MDPEGPPPLGGVNKPSLLRPTELMVFLFIDDKFTFIAVIINLSLAVIESWRTGARLVPDGGLMSV